MWPSGKLYNTVIEHMFAAKGCHMQSGVLTGRRLAIVLLLYARGPSTKRHNEVVEGRTRLTKMLFLLHKEHDVFRRVAKLDFEPYAFGPYDPQIYDDLAFLENMGWVRGSVVSEAASRGGFYPFRSWWVNRAARTSWRFSTLRVGEADLSFEYLMSGVSEQLPERYETRKYALSEKGEQMVQNAIRSVRNDKDFPAVMNAIDESKCASITSHCVNCYATFIESIQRAPQIQQSWNNSACIDRTL